MSDMPEGDSSITAKLKAAGWEIYFTLQSQGLLPPPVMLAIQYKQDRNWKRLLRNIGILLGAGALTAFIFGLIVILMQ